MLLCDVWKTFVRCKKNPGLQASIKAFISSKPVTGSFEFSKRRLIKIMKQFVPVMRHNDVDLTWQYVCVRLNDDTVGTVAESVRLPRCVRGFHPRTEQIFVWPTSSCSGSGCLCM